MCQIRSLTHLSAFVSDQGGEWLGVESAVAEAQASVHAVSCQLQSLLTDVVLMENCILVRLTGVAPPLVNILELVGPLLSPEPSRLHLYLQVDIRVDVLLLHQPFHLFASLHKLPNLFGKNPHLQV